MRQRHIGRSMTSSSTRDALALACAGALGLFATSERVTAQAGEVKEPIPVSLTPAAPAPTAPAEPEYTGPNKPIALDAKALSRLTLREGVVIEDFAVGSGRVLLPKANATFHLVGRVKGLKAFEDTYASKTPLIAPVDDMILPLRDALVGMREGGQRRVYLSADRAFGKEGVPDPKRQGQYLVPPDSEVIFELEVISARHTIVAPESKPEVGAGGSDQTSTVRVLSTPADILIQQGKLGKAEGDVKGAAPASAAEPKATDSKPAEMKPEAKPEAKKP